MSAQVHFDAWEVFLNGVGDGSYLHVKLRLIGLDGFGGKDNEQFRGRREFSFGLPYEFRARFMKMPGLNVGPDVIQA